MEFCHSCHNYWDEQLTTCPICGEDMDEQHKDEWVLLGTIDDKLSADFARESLESYDIPAVVISKSGFFGNIGLPLNPFYNPNAVASFEVSVPSGYIEEACQILDMTVGKNWHRKDN
ncbi:hypothetical protein GF420_08650 [candidate division GN15 bacterium]|nr:hypothetical protein [candidate division GN15 bacterium]